MRLGYGVVSKESRASSSNSCNICGLLKGASFHRTTECPSFLEMCFTWGETCGRRDMMCLALRLLCPVSVRVTGGGFKGVAPHQVCASYRVKH